MSLSQKHAGKVFVPWFNSAEWKHVYKILCLGSDKNYAQALYILKLWKTRTPLLSAGIEGTLILLEALLTEKKSLSQVQLAQIYSVSIMRFLNLSATNNEKQGTFHKMALKNDLPKWLISIRHDIAHNHKLPPISVLEVGLHQCLDWIKIKYWQVQNEIIRDYIVADSLRNSRVIDILEIYTELIFKLFSKNLDISEYDENTIRKINRIIVRKIPQTTTDISDIINILEEYLNENLTKSISESDKEQATKILMNGLLSIKAEVNQTGTSVIPRDFRNIWSNLLNILNENELLPLLFNELVETTNNIYLENTIRETAALWISELLLGLQKTQLVSEQLNNIEEDNKEHLNKMSISKIKSVLEKQYPQYDECLEFSSVNDVNVGMEFQDKILNTPNNYTLLFLEKVLRLNKNPEDYIMDTVNLVKNVLVPKGLAIDEQIFTVDNLTDINVPRNVENRIDSDEAVVVQVNTKINVSRPRWKRIKGTAIFENCPLGVLPHQSRIKNPLLAM